MVVGHGGLTSDSGGNEERCGEEEERRLPRLSGSVVRWASSGGRRWSHGLAGSGVFTAAKELGDGGGAALGSGERARRDLAWVKQIGQPAGAWRRRVRDGLTRGAIAGVRPPLGALGQTAVGHDLNGRSTVAPIQSLHQRLTARFGAD